jgi:NADH-quinone oxidoreductase subunit E
MSLRQQHGAEIDAILARYPQKRSAILALLYIAQDTYGQLTDEAVREVAQIIDVPPTDVFEVVGFYTLLYDDKVGKMVLQVCDDIPCAFCGAEELMANLQERLGIHSEETTPDGIFTLQRVKCLAACDKAPLLQANLDYYGNLDTTEKVDALLEQLRARVANNDRISISGRLAEQ